MTSHERVLTALNHRKPDRPPRLLYDELIGYVPTVKNLLEKRCLPKTPREYFQMDIAGVVLNPTRLSRERFAGWLCAEAKQTKKQKNVFSKTYDMSGEIPVDEWGVWFRQGGLEHFVHVESPLVDIEDLKRIQEFPWPDIDKSYRYQGMAEIVASLHAQGMAVAGYAGSIFEQAWYIRGMEKMLEDMMLEPDIAHFLFDRTAYYQKAVAVAMAKSGIDIIMLGDDVAMQTGLLMSIKTWRVFLKSRLAGTISAVKAVRPEAKIFYHSDGNLETLIPDLIESGVEVLNPVQPECMNLVELKQKYGKDLSFFGSVSVQHTMPFGTPEDVRNEIRTRIRTLGYDGGLILSPAHVLEPEVPWENIVAFFEAADELG